MTPPLAQGRCSGCRGHPDARETRDVLSFAQPLRQRRERRRLMPSLLSSRRAFLPSCRPLGPPPLRLLAPPPGGAVKRRVTLRRLTERGHSLDSSPVKASRPRAVPCLPFAVLWGGFFLFLKPFRPLKRYSVRETGRENPAEPGFILYGQKRSCYTEQERNQSPRKERT